MPSCELFSNLVAVNNIVGRLESGSNCDTLDILGQWRCRKRLERLEVEKLLELILQCNTSGATSEFITLGFITNKGRDFKPQEYEFLSYFGPSIISFFC